jgi:hypothetical protein
MGTRESVKGVNGADTLCMGHAIAIFANFVEMGVL